MRPPTAHSSISTEKLPAESISRGSDGKELWFCYFQQQRTNIFHGGGYSLGGPDRMAGFLTHLARRVGCRVIAPAYSLAPEAPYPAALHDAQDVIARFARERLDGAGLVADPQIQS
jgi:hypothetical protein